MYQTWSTSRPHMYQTWSISRPLVHQTPQRYQSTLKTPHKEKDRSRMPFDWKSLLIVACFGSIGILLMKHYKSNKLKSIDEALIRSYGSPKLGGDFELIDQDGEMRSNKDFIGKWLLIYFGFTNCPDICPEELEKMITAVEIVNRKSESSDLQPIFITIDPERDTPKAIKEYLKDFSDDFIGLSGSRDQIEVATKSFRVYYSAGAKDEVDGDYLVDHSIIMYLVDHNGDYCEYFGQNCSAAEIARNILRIMTKSKTSSK